MLLKRRGLLTALLTLVFCLTAVFPIAAVQPTAKDLVLVAVKNFDLGMNEGFYQKSQGEGAIEVTRFDGSLKEVAGDYSGATLQYSMQMDDAKKAVKISYDLDVKDIAREGDIYLHDDKLIFTRDFFLLLQDFGVETFEDGDVQPAEMPEFVYFADPQLAAVWEQMATYHDGQLPEEYTDLLVFLVEAIPDECFSLSSGKVTMQLDQDGLVDTIVNLMTKMTNESDRLAEILVSVNGYSFQQMGMDPAEVKRQIAADLKTITVPTREEVQAVTSLIEVRDFTFTYSLLPGGPKTFNADLAFKAPDGSVDGSFGLAVDAAGAKDNLKGTYRLTGTFNAVNGPNVGITCNGDYAYTDTNVHSGMTLDVTAKDNATGELLLDFGLTDQSVAEINTALDLVVPQLTAENSLDMSSLIPGPATSVTVERPLEPNLNLVVNGVNLHSRPGTGETGELTVPARAVLEQMGYEVEWIRPNELRVTGDGQEISLFLGQNGYTVNGAEKSLAAVPEMRAGNAMIPLSFVAGELGARVDLTRQTITITN